VSRGTGRMHPRYEEYARAVARRLDKELRIAKVSPYSMARYLGVHRGVLSHYLNANLLPTPAMLVLMARTLVIPVSRLLPARLPKRRVRKP
jgi:hypothetical protein